MKNDKILLVKKILNMAFPRLKSNMLMLTNLNFIPVLLLIRKIMRLTLEKKNSKIMTQIYTIHHCHLHHQ